MADIVAFVLEFLRGLMPLHPPPLSPQLPPFVLLILSSHFTATLVHLYPPLSLSLYLLPSISLTLLGRGRREFSRSGNLSGKVWLFNFLAAVCRRTPPPPTLTRVEETSISAPDEHFFFLPCQPSYRVTLMTVELCFPRTDYRRAD